MFMHDTRHSGSSDDIAVVDNQLIWSFSADKEDMSNAIASSPAVVGDVVYTASQNGYVYALDARSGACYWKFDVSIDILGTISSPVVADGVVYIGGGAPKIFAINAYTGTEIWSAPLDKPTPTSTPAVSGGIVYIGSFENFYAFNISNGQRVWN